ncbi:MAG: tRNA threonylcarbamoyladenosine dehydratase [Spirochaetaceae bacterium]|jgi:tRNA A37 threonylcarbamoyladenosine dehydratase|nr:tRNA threonylcarbamoyladenosine dehydratase [Spirochaetaceae bacterium]
MPDPAGEASNSPAAFLPQFQRLALITGAAVMEKLAGTRVIIFGLGGVGSWCAEALARSGIGSMALVDSDFVCITNINRQVQAAGGTIGQPKTAALKARLAEINPDCRITTHEKAFSRDTADGFRIETYDFVIDAIDSLGPKLDLIELCDTLGKKLFSSMGMAQKLDPSLLRTADIWETAACPLARLVRAGLRKRGFTGHFTVVYSRERLPLHTEISTGCGGAGCLCPPRNDPGGADGGAGNSRDWCASKKVINGSAVTVTAAAGMILASLVIRYFTEEAAAGSQARSLKGRQTDLSSRTG